MSLAFSTCHSFKITNRNLLDALLEDVMNNLPRYSFRTIANIISYSVSLQYINHQFFDTLAIELRDRIYKSRHLSNKIEEVERVEYNKANHTADLLSILQVFISFSQIQVIKTELFKFFMEFIIENFDRASLGIIISFTLEMPL